MGGSDDDEETGLINTKKTKYFNKVKADEVESFIRSSYYICILLFMLLGVGVAGTIFGGVYKHSPLTENILITIAGPIYLVLFLILLCCGRQTILRVALVILITTFVAFMSGFLCGANLKMVAQTLKDS